MEVNDLIKKALWEVKVEGKSFRAAARENGISYNMLHRHANKKEIGIRAGRKSNLEPNEKETLKKYVIFCLEHGFPRRRQDIIDAAHQILEQRLGENVKKPGKKWLSKFLKENNFTLRKTESLSRASACLAKENIAGWFENVYEVLEKEGNTNLLLHPSRIFNADETFMLLNPTSSSAVAPIGTKNMYEVKGELVF